MLFFWPVLSLLLCDVVVSEAHDPTPVADDLDVATQGVGRETQEKARETLQKVFGVPGEGSPPDPQVPPQFMTELYKTVTDPSGVTGGRSPYNARVVRSFIERDNSRPQFFYFNISGLEPTEKVLGAELHLHRRRLAPPPAAAPSPYYVLRVFQVLNESRLDNPDYHRPLNVHYVSAHVSGWEVFNVKVAVLDWLSGKSVNRGLLVTATNVFGDAVDVRFARRDAQHNSIQPILVLFDDDDQVSPSSAEATPPPNLLAIYPHYYMFQSDNSSGNDIQNSTSERRQRRSSHAHNTTMTSSDSGMCARHPLYVDFTQIGWSDWVVAPTGYDAYHCKGHCNFPLSLGRNTTNHAIVQSIVQTLSEYKAVGRPCCVPTSLVSRHVLYLDAQYNVILKQYQGMTVEGCGCR